MSARVAVRHINSINHRTITTSTRQNQTLQLSDGRTIGFAEYGDPEGTPLLFFHGFPSSRLECGPVDQILRRVGIRAFALDRPGFGLSSPQPGRRIIDWPADVQEFARAQKLARFSVMGGSGGGPYALACAHMLPRNVLTGVGLFASAPPWAAGPHYMSLSRRILRFTAVHWPAGLRALLDATVRGVRWLVNTGPVARRLDAWLEAQDKKKESSKAEAEAEDSEKIPEEIPETRTVSERREALVHLVLGEPFAQGAGATAHEAELLSSTDWGFAFEDVQYNPVRIWHGVQDTNAPIVAIRYLTDRLPHATLHECEGETHYTMIKHLEAALSELVRDANAKQQLKSGEEN